MQEIINQLNQLKEQIKGQPAGEKRVEDAVELDKMEQIGVVDEIPNIEEELIPLNKEETPAINTPQSERIVVEIKATSGETVRIEL